MVDIVHILLAVNQADEVLNDLDDVLLGQDALVGVGIKAQLGIDAETAHLAQVIALLAEEQVGDHLTGAIVIGRLGVAQLAVDEVDRLLATVTGVLVEGVEDNLVIAGVHILAVQQDCCHARLQNLGDILFLQFSVTVDDHIVTLDAYYLAGILVDKVLTPGTQHAGSQLAADSLLEVSLVDLDLLGQPKDLDDIVVRLKPDGSQQGRHG